MEQPFLMFLAGSEWKRSEAGNLL